MEIRLGKTRKMTGIRKHSFTRKCVRDNGLVLQVHHTLAGQAVPVHFKHAVFQDITDILSVSDIKGNIFMIDLIHNRFWALPNVSECFALAFSPSSKSNLFVSSTGCDIKIINFETGKEVSSLKGHSLPPSQLTFGGESRKWLLSASQCQYKKSFKDNSEAKAKNNGEAIVWDLSSCSQAHFLNIRPDSGIKKALFMEGLSSGQILVCFEDDAIFVWQFGKFECMKQILPVTSREVKHHIKAIAFTRNGRAMVIGGKSHSLIIFSLDTWIIEKVIDLPDGVCGIKQLQFLSKPFDGGSNRVLAILSSKCEVFFLDLPSSTLVGSLINIENNKICKIVCSHSGSYMACVLSSGEINIYCTATLLKDVLPSDIGSIEHPIKIERPINKSSSCIRKVIPERLKNDPRGAVPKQKPHHASEKRLSSVTKKIRSEVDKKHLIRMLREVGEFPSRSRMLAWRTALLQLPCNRKAFSCLIARGLHPSYANLEEKYPLENHAELRNLKRLLSCLAHWSPLFSQVSYLPLLCYPFVKLFIHDLFSGFEVVATVLINYCQNWFEFFPFPPINVLAAIENLLGYHDIDLLQYFITCGIDTRVYAWPLLQVAFSEVLSNEEWLRLWDHILANEPAFFLATVPAYCIVCKSALLSCKNLEDFQFFFQNQNPINMDRFISKIYSIFKTTASRFHPNHYLKEFEPLPKGDSYPVFSQYPKVLVDGHAEKLLNVQQEEEEIIRKELDVLKLLKKKEEQIVLAEKTNVQQKNLTELEKAYRMALQIEEEKIAKRQLKLINLQRELIEKKFLLEQIENSREKETKDKDIFTNRQLEEMRESVEKSLMQPKMPLQTRNIEDDITSIYQNLFPTPRAINKMEIKADSVKVDADASERLTYTGTSTNKFESNSKGKNLQPIEERTNEVISTDNTIQNLKQQIKILKNKLHRYNISMEKERENEDKKKLSPISDIFPSEKAKPVDKVYKRWFCTNKESIKGSCESQSCRKAQLDEHAYKKKSGPPIKTHTSSNKEGMKLICNPDRDNALNCESFLRSSRDDDFSELLGRDIDVDYARCVSKQWEIFPNSSNDMQPWKNFLDFPIFRNEEDLYHKEKDAIQKAMETRANIISTGNFRVSEDVT